MEPLYYDMPHALCMKRGVVDEKHIICYMFASEEHTS